MKIGNNLFEELSYSEVFLEEDNHIYINKVTGKFYNSVTGLLSLIKNEFNQDEAIKGITRQYQTFLSWFNFSKIPSEHLIEYLSLYINYRQFTVREEKEFEGRKYSGYAMQLKDYVTPSEFYIEYSFLKETQEIKRKKNIYIGQDGKLMNKASILEMWKDMTDIANHYGNIVHVTLEREILEKQGLLDLKNDVLLQAIQDHFFWIKKHLPLFYEKYPNSNHSFEEYELNCTLGELMTHIIIEFYKVHQFVGRCIVPEKRLLYKNLTGTKDIHEDIDGYLFNTGDHKTNKDFSFTSEYNQRLLAPFNHLVQSEFNLYTLQLSIYSFMVEQVYNKKLNGQYITYYNRKYGAFKKFEIPYLKDEAEVLIQLNTDWIEERKKRFLCSSLGGLIEATIKPIWMDHFAKSFYYFVKSSKEKGDTDVKVFKDFIFQYEHKYKNVTYHG